jgi:hypothetical protein
VELEFRVLDLIIYEGSFSARSTDPVHEGDYPPTLLAGELSTFRLFETLERFDLPRPGCPILSARGHGHLSLWRNRRTFPGFTRPALFCPIGRP